MNDTDILFFVRDIFYFISSLVEKSVRIGGYIFRIKKIYLLYFSLSRIWNLWSHIISSERIDL